MKWIVVIWREVKWTEVIWRQVKWSEVKRFEVKWSEAIWREVKWIEVMICGDMCVLSLIYIYVALCSFCAVNFLITIRFYLLYSNFQIYVV